MPRMRLDKLLAHLNCGSRKEVQAMIRAGRVQVDGVTERDPAAKVDADTAQVVLDGQAQHYQAQRYYMLNKPAGVITASRDERHDTVLELFPEEMRRGLFAVGRLDKDTEGLLLLTDDGALNHALTSPRRHVDKRYRALVSGTLADDAVQQFSNGLTLGDGTKCRPAELTVGEVQPDGLTEVFVVLREGKYHQVKRMVAAVGGHVEALERLSMGPLVLDAALARGQYRPLTEEEIAALFAAISGGS